MAQDLQVLALDAPAVNGLNTEEASRLEDPRWAVVLDNAVFDAAGRVAARKGWNKLTTTGAHSDDIESIHEYVKDRLTSEIIHAAGLKLYRGTTTLTDVTGTISTPTANDWKLVNFNGKVVGFQQGHQPIVYSGTTFADITPSAGTAPKGNAAVATHGRLFAADTDGITIKFCALLDETDWGGAGAGSLNTAEIWPDGLDIIQALAEWQDRLLIFGKRSILIFTGLEDPVTSLALASGSGLDDIITAGGAESRDSVASIGNDLLYIARDGVRSVQRGLQFSTLPLTAGSDHVRTKLVDDIDSASVIRACYSRTEGAYVARIGGSYWYFDVKHPLETGGLRASRWFGIGFKSCAAATDGTIYLGQNGVVADYSGYHDDTATYQMRCLSAWMRPAPGQLTLPKHAIITVNTPKAYTFNLLWAFDFVDRLQSCQVTLPSVTGVAEWNLGPAGGGTAEWGIGEWSGGASLVRRVRCPMTRAGNRLQVGWSVTVDGSPFAVSIINVFAKIGRLAA